MSEESNNASDRLEGMLRRWGADEAARQVRISPPPKVSAGGSKPARRTMWRWLPTAMAAGLLLAAGALFVASRWGLQAGRDQANQGEEIQRLRQANQELAAQADKARQAATQAEQKLAYAEAKTLSSMADRESEYKAKLANAEVDSGKRITALEEAITGKDKELKGLDGRLKDLQGEKGRLEKDLLAVGSKEDTTEKKLSAAAQEMSRVRKMHDEAEQSKRKVETELALVSAQREALLLDFQRAYLGTARGEPEAGGREAGTSFALMRTEAPAASLGGLEDLLAVPTLRVRQEAARRNRLVQRCAEIRKADLSLPTRKLLDQLEVVLLRLEMLDTRDAGSVLSFAGLVREGDLVGQIDRALGSGREGLKSRAWLLEVRCVLMGADRAS